MNMLKMYPHETNGSVGSGTTLGIPYRLNIRPNEGARLHAVHYLGIRNSAGNTHLGWALSHRVTHESKTVDLNFQINTNAVFQDDLVFAVATTSFRLTSSGGHVEQYPIVVPLYGMLVGTKIIALFFNEASTACHMSAVLFWEPVTIGTARANMLNMQRSVLE